MMDILREGKGSARGISFDIQGRDTLAVSGTGRHRTEAAVGNVLRDS